MQQLTIFDYLPSQERPVDICERLFKPGRQPRMVAGKVRALASEVVERIAAQPIPVELQTNSAPEAVCLKQTPLSPIMQPFAEQEWSCGYCGSKMLLFHLSDDKAKFCCSKNKKHFLEFTHSGMDWSNHTGGNSGPLPDMLRNYFNGEFGETQKALVLLAFDLRGEKTGNIEDEQYRKQVFLETGKVINLHVERAKAGHLAALKKANSTPVSSSSVNSDQAKPCRAGKGKVHLVKPGSERALCNFRPGYSSSGWLRSDAAPNCPRCIRENEALVPAPETNVRALELEAQDLRLKLAEADRKRGLVKQSSDLKAAIDAAINEINRLCMHGYSESLDAMLARKQAAIDAMNREYHALNEEIGSTIIPVTWRWEERLAEIEKELDQAKGGQA